MSCSHTMAVGTPAVFKDELTYCTDHVATHAGTPHREAVSLLQNLAETRHAEAGISASVDCHTKNRSISFFHRVCTSGLKSKTLPEYIRFDVTKPS